MASSNNLPSFNFSAHNTLLQGTPIGLRLFLIQQMLSQVVFEMDNRDEEFHVDIIRREEQPDGSEIKKVVSLDTHGILRAVKGLQANRKAFMAAKAAEYSNRGE